MELNKLKEKIPYSWKIQSFNDKDRKLATKATCVAYIDARDVEEILDKVCGPENWQDDYKVINGNLYGGIGIKTLRADHNSASSINVPSYTEEWVWKWDCGTKSDYEAEKGEASDAFKRAAVKWGVGRFLYEMKMKWVNVNAGKPVDESGKVIYDLTEYFRNRETK